MTAKILKIGNIIGGVAPSVGDGKELTAMTKNKDTGILTCSFNDGTILKLKPHESISKILDHIFN